MRKDIQIPEVKEVYVAAVSEFNEVHRTKDWNAYLINASNRALEMVLIVSKGFGEDKVTSQMRHKLETLPAKSYAKIEFMEDSVLILNNEFSITFFAENHMYEKKYLFPAKSIKEENVSEIPVMPKKGVLAE